MIKFLIFIITILNLNILKADNFVKNSPSNLKESINTAVKLNPKTVSTDQLLESIHFATLSQIEQNKPNLNLNCGIYYYDSQSNYNSGINFPSKYKYKSCSISINYNLYDGGAYENRVYSTKANEESTKASYNTADSLIPNTRGGLANSTMMTYLGIVQEIEQIAFFKKTLQLLYKLKKIGPNKNVELGIDSVNQTLDDLKANLGVAIENYEHLVTVKPSSDLEGLDETIKSLEIPISYEAAIDMALKNGPEIKRRNSSVEMALYNLKAEKASQRPRIDLSLGHNQNRTNDYISSANNYSNKGWNVGISINKTFDFQSSLNEKSASKYLASKESEREAAIDEAKNSIKTTYQKLNNLNIQYQNYNKRFSAQTEYFIEIINKIETNDVSNLNILELLNALDSMTGLFFQRQRSQFEIITSKYNIQQVTGLLFSEYIPFIEN